MKILTLTTLIAAALISFSSCNKQYNTETTDSTAPNNNNGSGGGGAGFGWHGTAPLSAKLNDTAYLPQTVTFSEGGGYTGISFGDLNWSFTIVVPSSTQAGQVLPMPTPGVFTGGNPITGVVLAGWAGKIKVVTNDANTFEGYFYGDLKDATNPAGPAAPTVVKVREGYFKVSKQ